MSGALGEEQGRDVLTDAPTSARPVLYDAQGRPLVRRAGFAPPDKESEE